MSAPRTYLLKAFRERVRPSSVKKFRSFLMTQFLLPRKRRSFRQLFWWRREFLEGREPILSCAVNRSSGLRNPFFDRLGYEDSKLMPIFRGQWRILSASCRARHASFSLLQTLGFHFQKFHYISPTKRLLSPSVQVPEWFLR